MSKSSKSQIQPVPPRRSSRSAILRRPPSGGWPLHKLRAKLLWRRLLEQQWLFIVLFLGIGAWCMLPQRALLVPVVDAGSIASRTWVADRQLSVVDEEETRLLQERAQQDLPPVYDLDRNAESAVQRQIGRAHV